MHNDHGITTTVYVDSQAHWGDGFDFRIKHKIYDGGRVRSVAFARVVFEQLEEKYVGRDLMPAFSLNKQEAQQLMDSLWHCGLRPTEGSGSAGALAATQHHLDDMRALVFKTKPKE